MFEDEEELNKEMEEMQKAEKADLDEPHEEVKIEEPEKEKVEQLKEELPKEEVKEEVKEEKEKHWAINAMHEERLKRKDLQDQIGKMEERFQQFMEKQTPKVDYEENPAEYLKSEVESLKKQLNQSGLTPEQIRERESVQKRQQEFYNDFTQSESMYQKERPDYQDAVKYLYDQRMAEYKTMGYNDQLAFQLTQKDAWQIAQDAMERGQNGPEIFYNLAKGRGYAVKKAEPSEVEKLKEVAEKIETSQGLGSSGDSPGELSLADLASLDDDEFDKFTSGDSWRKAMGG